MLSLRTPSVRDYFPYEPTDDQALLFTQLDAFLRDQLPGRKVFVLRGYAGTGKTTVVSALVQWLHKMQRKYTLMAPTGRAAKVMAGYAGVAASTIHKKIYRQTSGTPSERLNFQRQPNRAEQTLYIVDEASMISDEKAFGENGLLDDLMGFVFEKTSNKLLLIGDTAQLPPVGQLLSPALDPELLAHRFRAEVGSVELPTSARKRWASSSGSRAGLRSWPTGGSWAVSPMSSSLLLVFSNTKPIKSSSRPFSPKAFSSEIIEASSTMYRVCSARLGWRWKLRRSEGVPLVWR